MLFTCGGTAGHINPAVALAGMFRQRQNAEVLFVGADGRYGDHAGAPGGLSGQDGHHHQLYRSLSGAAIKHNLTTLKNLSRSRGRPGPFWTNSGPIWWWAPVATPPTPWCGRPPAGAFGPPSTSPMRSLA